MKHAAKVTLLFCCVGASAIVAGGQTSRPSTQPADSYPALRSRLLELSKLLSERDATIKQLTAEVADLRKQLATALEGVGRPKRTLGRLPNSISDFESVVRTDLRKGLRTDDLVWLLGKADSVERRGNGDVWVYQRNEMVASMPGGVSPVNRYVLEVFLDGSGTVVDFRERFI
jgi:hypothetical protein